MNSAPWAEGNFPPAPPLATAAEGLSAGGVRWEIRVGGTREECLTLLDIVLIDGHKTGGGGLGGPALPLGRLMALSVHRSDRGIHYLVGRVHPSIKRLHLEFTNGLPELDLQPVGGSSEFGVSFVATILPTSEEVVNVTAWDGSGSCIADQSTTNPAMFFHRERRDLGAGASTGDCHTGWTPFESL